MSVATSPAAAPLGCGRWFGGSCRGLPCDFHPFPVQFRTGRRTELLYECIIAHLFARCNAFFSIFSSTFPIIRTIPRHKPRGNISSAPASSPFLTNKAKNC